MLNIGRRSALKLTAGRLTAAGLMAMPAIARAEPTKIVIATGVDPSFSAYYVAKEMGFFEKNGLDVQVNTGPSGSSMVALLIQGQVQSAYGAEQAGLLDHNLDPNVVAVAEGAMLAHWYGIVGRDVPNVEALKGKKMGIARGSGSEVFWLAVVDKLKLNLKDYTIVQVEAPEMVAALERGDIDAYSSWEPWITRGVAAVKGARVVLDNDGIIEGRVYIYMNKDWVLKNHDAALSFMRSLIEATDAINTKPAEAAAAVAKFLKLDLAFSTSLMKKLSFDIHLDQQSIGNFQIAEAQLKSINKLPKPVDWAGLVYPDLLRELAPAKVSYKLPEA
jgi:ABC-type nitrate/sulfonate/bicarbonate transport system substrate-binding protein